jgi:hypothetical protein
MTRRTALIARRSVPPTSACKLQSVRAIEEVLAGLKHSTAGDQ